MLRRIAIAASLLAALVAGCGGGAPQTKAGYISEADGVCQKAFGELARAEARDPGTAQEVAQANKVLAKQYDDLTGNLADVELPAAPTARKGAQQFIASLRRADPLLDELRGASDRFLAAAKANDATSLARAGTEMRAALDKFRAARAESDKTAISYGLNFCGNLG